MKKGNKPSILLGALLVLCLSVPLGAFLGACSPYWDVFCADRDRERSIAAETISTDSSGNIRKRAKLGAIVVPGVILVAMGVAAIKGKFKQ